MANHKSAKTRIRRNGRAALVNQARRSRIRTFVKKARELIEGKDVKAAEAAVQLAQKELYRGVAKNLVKKNTAARTVSRLTGHIKALKLDKKSAK